MTVEWVLIAALYLLGMVNGLALHVSDIKGAWQAIIFWPLVALLFSIVFCAGLIFPSVRQRVSRFTSEASK